MEKRANHKFKSSQIKNPLGANQIINSTFEIITFHLVNLTQTVNQVISYDKLLSNSKKVVNCYG